MSILKVRMQESTRLEALAKLEAELACLGADGKFGTVTIVWKWANSRNTSVVYTATWEAYE
jgi:hypothetical protein